MTATGGSPSTTTLASTCSPSPSGSFVEKTLPVLWQECRHVHKRRDTFGTSCRSLRCDNAAHAVADHDGRFGIGRQHLTPTACVAIQADLARRSVVAARPRQVERLH